MGVVEPKIERVQLAVDRAQRVLWKTQRTDGSWDVAADIGAWVCAQVVVVLRYLEQLGPDDTAAAGRWLAAQQQADGSFTIQRYAKEGDLGSTACGWAALEMCGAHEAAAAAKAWVDTHGGVNAVIARMAEQDFAALFLGMAGLVDANLIPCPSTTLMMPPPVMTLMETRFHAGVLMGAYQTEFLVRRLRGEFGKNGRGIGLLGMLKGRAAIALFRQFQNPEGSFNGATAITAMTLPMLDSIDTSESRTMRARALGWLQSQRLRDARGMYFTGYGTNVWSTAFDTRALLAGGISPADPDVSRALTWMADAQLNGTQQPQLDNRKPNALRTGGWGFQKNNATMPDNDDAAVTLSPVGMALGDHRLPAALRPRLAKTAELGRRWILDMQNPDGGWSAFVWNLGTKPAGPIMSKAPHIDLSSVWSMAGAFFSPPPVTQDPSTEDVTGRVLHALGQLGERANSSPSVARAVEFLKKQQWTNGAWWGRWVVNYLSASAFVVLGLKAVGVDLREPWVRRAIDWMISKQNANGGWGEGPASYRSDTSAGVGPTMLPLTGLVVQALIDAGEGDSEAVKKAVTLLLDSQRADGTWVNGEFLHVNIPPDTFYVYPEAARFYPTEALGKYLAHREHPSTAGDDRVRWSNARLDPLRQVTDPAADDVIAAIFARGQADAVNALMYGIFKTTEPLPPGLPPEAAAYFSDTALPAWADLKQIALAEQLFTRTGWQLAMGLFCSSLPQAYAAAHGAHVITQTQGMTKHTKQRIFETAQFLFDVMDEGALRPGGRGVLTAKKVRLMHATIRHLILRENTWDAAKFGLPINQEDLAGTLMTFSVVTLDGLRLLEIPFSAEEGDAWLHAWKVVGHLLGLRDELLPTDLIDAEELMEAIRDRQWRSSDDGEMLAKPLVEMMQSYFPGDAFDGFPIALVRALAGDHCADLLGLPPGDWTRQVLDAATVISEWIPQGDSRSPSAQVFAWATHTFMEAVVLAEREGKNARFRIPKSLSNTIDPNF